jgi:hypothetical protein
MVKKNISDIISSPFPTAPYWVNPFNVVIGWLNINGYGFIQIREYKMHVWFLRKAVRFSYPNIQARLLDMTYNQIFFPWYAHNCILTQYASLDKLRASMENIRRIVDYHA